MRQAFVDTIFELARDDERVCYIGSDLSPEIADRMKAEMPGRAWMEGVAEQYCLDMATGLAIEGKIPWVHTISTFLTRKGYEQIAIAAQQNLPLRLLGNGGGLIYAPLGPTHLAIDDIGLMRLIPNMTVICPSDGVEAVQLARTYSDYPGPIYFRVGVDHLMNYWLDHEVREEILILSTGSISAQAFDAARILSCRASHEAVVKPFDRDKIMMRAVGCQAIVTVEEHNVIGGLASALMDAPGAGSPATVKKYVRLGIPDEWPTHYGSRDDLLRHYGLTAEQIAERIRRELL